MNKRDATRWAKALRSGKYKQGRHLLHDTVADTYCCLGVLCEISGVRPDPLLTRLPDSVSDRFNLRSNYGVVREGTAFGRRSLADANDEGVSFRRIAAWIEKNYRKL